MKLLCDVHISFKLVDQFKSFGFEAFHINDILDKWFTSDSKICEFADGNDSIVVTKNFDFRNTFCINNTPKKLIKINPGNCSNSELIRIFSENIKKIEN